MQFSICLKFVLRFTVRKIYDWIQYEEYLECIEGGVTGGVPVAGRLKSRISARGGGEFVTAGNEHNVAGSAENPLKWGYV